MTVIIIMSAWAAAVTIAFLLAKKAIDQAKAERDEAYLDARKALRQLLVERSLHDELLALHTTMQMEMRRLLGENTSIRNSYVRLTLKTIQTSFTIDEHKLDLMNRPTAERAMNDSMAQAADHLKKDAENNGWYIVTPLDILRTEIYPYGTEYTVSVGVFPMFAVPNSGIIEFNGQRVLVELDESDITEIDQVMTRWSRRLTP